MAEPGKKKKRKAVILGLDWIPTAISASPPATISRSSAARRRRTSVMTEKAIKINEKLKARGKQLEEVSREEFDDIAHEVGLKKHKPRQ